MQRRRIGGRQWWHCCLKTRALASAEFDLAERLGLVALPDPGDLNAALAEGVRWASDSGAHRLLILPADLPLLRAADVTDLLDASVSAPAIAIARTRDGGTGGLVLFPPDVIAPHFGPASFHRHIEAARAAGVAVNVVEREGLARDLDTVADLRFARGAVVAGRECADD